MKALRKSTDTNSGSFEFDVIYKDVDFYSIIISSRFDTIYVHTQNNKNDLASDIYWQHYSWIEPEWSVGDFSRCIDGKSHG